MRSILAAIILTTTLSHSPSITNHALAGEVDQQQICDIDADYSLAVEDYSEAIRRHVEVLRKHPDNALAHYHLGFALGMVGDRVAEVREYQRAEGLGLMNWDLFLNLGLARLENGDLDLAADALRSAVNLGGDHYESHYDLAVVEERLGMLADAERETLMALRLNPVQPETRNLLGVVYAQQGKTADASLVWRDLMREVPDYEPARTNLAILGNPNEVANGETAAVRLPRAAAVNAIPDERELIIPTAETPLNASSAQYEGR